MQTTVVPRRVKPGRLLLPRPLLRMRRAADMGVAGVNIVRAVAMAVTAVDTVAVVTEPMEGVDTVAVAGTKTNLSGNATSGTSANGASTADHGSPAVAEVAVPSAPLNIPLSRLLRT